MILNCQHCNCEYEEYKRKNSKYCSQKCYIESKRGKYYVKEGIPFICEHCGQVFEPRKRDSRIKYCSRKCCLDKRSSEGYLKEYYEKNKDKWKELQGTKEHKDKKNEARNKKYAEDEEYREKQKTRAKEYNAKNPTAKHKTKLKKYGLTIEEYDKILLKQNNKCAICGAKFADSIRNRLSVDHNHKTQKVRGLLCAKCNFGIGQFNDDAELMLKAIEYLKAN